jgi:hypothetical protein
MYFDEEYNPVGCAGCIVVILSLAGLCLGCGFIVLIFELIKHGL